jgi:hypothetical protein
MRVHLAIILLVLATVPVLAQRDTSAHGTIHISRPGIKAHVSVSAEYAVYLHKSDAPRLGTIRGSRLKYIRSGDLQSFGQNEEKPMAMIDKVILGKTGPPVIRKTEMPNDTVTGYRMGDSLVDIPEFLAQHIQYTYKFKDAPAVDTVQLRIMINKRGHYAYSFVGRADSLSRTGPRCMEGLTLVHKWQPAHVFYARTGPRQPRRIKAYAEILLTIVLTTEDFPGPDEVTKKEGESGQ